MRKPVLLTGSALALLLSASAFSSSAHASECTNGAPLQTDAFGPGTSDCYLVPAGVTKIRATVVGARGGGDGYGYTLGGAGAIVQAQVDVTPGQLLSVEVGAPGDDAPGLGMPAYGGGRSSLNGLLVAGGGGGAGNRGDDHNTFSQSGGAGGSAGVVAGAGQGAPNSSTGGRGGTGGTELADGLGGAGSPGSCQGDLPGYAGGDGLFGMGGHPGSIAVGDVGFGGGGGAGHTGGGGGGGGSYGFESGCSNGGGGGGGAGSSFIDPSVDGGTIATDTTGSPLITITAGGVAALTTDATNYGLLYGVQAQGTLGAAQVVELTSTGTTSLRIDALTIGGADPDDFLVSGDTCRHNIPVGGTCQVSVRFTPQATGLRDATLQILGNAGTSVSLSGFGGPLPKGDQGDAGAAGATGPTGATGLAGVPGSAGPAGSTGATGLIGATGPTGRPGVDASTKCLILTSKTQDGKSAASVLCTVNSVASKAGARAKLTRRGATVATGVEAKGGALKLQLRAGVTLKPGVYRLSRTYHQRNRTVTERRKVTLR